MPRNRKKKNNKSFKNAQKKKNPINQHGPESNSQQNDELLATKLTESNEIVNETIESHGTVEEDLPVEEVDSVEQDGSLETINSVTSESVQSSSKNKDSIECCHQKKTVTFKDDLPVSSNENLINILDDIKQNQAIHRNVNAIFPKSYLDFSKRKQRSTNINNLPRILDENDVINEENYPKIVEAKIIEQESIEESCLSWNKSELKSSEAVEIIFIPFDSNSSSTDLLYDLVDSDCYGIMRDKSSEQIGIPELDINKMIAAAHTTTVVANTNAISENNMHICDDTIQKQNNHTEEIISSYFQPPASDSIEKISQNNSHHIQSEIVCEKILNNNMETCADNRDFNKEFCEILKSAELPTTSSLSSDSVVNCDTKSRNNKLVRNESLESQSTNQSQCTVIDNELYLQHEYDSADIPTTTTTDLSSNQIKPLRIICSETLKSMPYGEDILEELASVAESISNLTDKHENRLNVLKNIENSTNFPQQQQKQQENSIQGYQIAQQINNLPLVEKSPTPPPIPPLPNIEMASKRNFSNFNHTEKIVDDDDHNHRLLAIIRNSNEKSPNENHIHVETIGTPKQPQIVSHNETSKTKTISSEKFSQDFNRDDNSLKFNLYSGDSGGSGSGVNFIKNLNSSLANDNNPKKFVKIQEISTRKYMKNGELVYDITDSKDESYGDIGSSTADHNNNNNSFEKHSMRDFANTMSDLKIDKRINEDNVTTRETTATTTTNSTNMTNYINRNSSGMRERQTIDHQQNFPTNNFIYDECGGHDANNIEKSEFFKRENFFKDFDKFSEIFDNNFFKSSTNDQQQKNSSKVVLIPIQENYERVVELDETNSSRNDGFLRKYKSTENIDSSKNNNYHQAFNCIPDNITKPFQKEVELCIHGKNRNIKAPRLTASTSNLSNMDSIWSSKRHSYCTATPRDHPYCSQIHTKRYSMPVKYEDDSSSFFTKNEKELQDEIQQLEANRLNLLRQINDMHMTEKMRRNTQRYKKCLPTVSEDDVFRRQMHDEWLNKIAEREERRSNKIIKISKTTKSCDNLNAKNDISNEFLKRVKERRVKLAMPSDSDWESGAESQPINCKSETPPLPNVKVYEGQTETELKNLPKHMIEFAECVKRFEEEHKNLQQAIWSPGSTTELNLDALNRDQQPKESSQTLENSGYRPIRFESPVLQRKYVRQDSTPIAPPPWSVNGNQTLSNVKALSCSNLNSNPPIRTQSTSCIKQDYGPATTHTVIETKTTKEEFSSGDIKPNEIIYSVRELENDKENPKIMTQLSRRKFDGIGPTNKDGLPLVLKSEVKQDNQHQWYKKMFNTLHKVNDGGRYLYNPSGYNSEPENNKDYDNSRIITTSTTTRRRTTSAKNPDDHRNYATMPNLMKFPSDSTYKPGKIENFTPGHSSVSERERKEWWDEVMEIFNGHSETQKLSPKYTEGNLSRALQQQGYESDTNIVVRKKEDQRFAPLSPIEQKYLYRDVQAGGVPPIQGFRKAAPEKVKANNDYNYLPISPIYSEIKFQTSNSLCSKPKSRNDSTIISPSFIPIKNFPSSHHTHSPPNPPKRASSKTRTTLKCAPKLKTPTSDRHQRCFGSNFKANGVATRKHKNSGQVLRSKSAGTVTQNVSLADILKDCTNFSGKSAGNCLRRNSTSPALSFRFEKIRQSSPSPIAFGRSLSKEHAFAVEKKRLEQTLPCGGNFTASTNILKDPSLKSPDEIKKAVQKYAKINSLCKSKSELLNLSPGYSLPTKSSSRQHCCLNKPNAAKRKHCDTRFGFVSRGIDIHQYSPDQRNLQSNKNLAKKAMSSNLTNSTLSIDSNASRRTQILTPKTITNTKKCSSITAFDDHCRKTSQPNVHTSKSAVHQLFFSNKNSRKVDKLKTNRNPEKPVNSINYVQTLPATNRIDKKLTTKDDIKISSKRCPELIWKFEKKKNPSLIARSIKTNTNKSNSNLLESTLKKLTPIAMKPLETALKIRKSLKESFQDQQKSMALRQQKSIKYENTLGIPEIFPAPLDYNFQKSSLNYNSTPHCRFESPTFPQFQSIPVKKSFSPTREIRIDPNHKLNCSRSFSKGSATEFLFQRELRSPSRRRIESFRENHRNNTKRVIRCKSLNTGDKEPVDYDVNSMPHRSYSLSQLDEKKINTGFSQKFLDLSKFYANIERFGELERMTSATDLRPMRKDGDQIDFEDWRKIREHEKNKKELMYVLQQLKQDEREKDFVFRVKEINDMKWKHNFDCSIRCKKKSVEDLRDNFEKRIKLEKLDESKFRRVIYKPFSRRNSSTDLPKTNAMQLNEDDQEKCFGLSKRVISTLSQEQVHKIKHQLSQIYSSNTTTTQPTNNFKQNLQTDKKLKTKNHSEKDQIDNKSKEDKSIKSKKDVAQIYNQQTVKQFEGVEEPLRSSKTSEQQRQIINDKSKIDKKIIVETERTKTPPSQLIEKKIEYFEKKKTEEPIKTIYHARENSSTDDEEEILREIEKNIKSKRKETEDCHVDYPTLSASVTNLKELYGENKSSRINFPIINRSPTALSDEIEYRNSYLHNDDLYSHSFSLRNFYRSRSISPVHRNPINLLSNINTGDVRKIRNKFESLNHQQESYYNGTMRKIRSDPGLNLLENIATRNALTDAAKHENKYLPRFRKHSSPIPRNPIKKDDLMMPHIDIISKTASLKHEMLKDRNLKSPNRNSYLRGNEVRRIRDKFEENSSLLRQSYSSSPDIRELKNITTHLNGEWIAHKYPVERTKRKSTIHRRYSTSPPKNRIANCKSATLLNSVYDISDKQQNGLPKHLHGAVKFKEFDVEPSTPDDSHTNGLNDSKSPYHYIESDVNIHFKTPIRYEYKNFINDNDLALKQTESIKTHFPEERKRKFFQELQDVNNRRHLDNFIPSQKSPISLNRFDDFEYLKPVRALFNFNGQTNRELSFKKGDIIYVRRKLDNNWFEGEHNGMTGLFPANYIEELSHQTYRMPVKKVAEGQARVKFNFQSQSAIELSLNKGELVTLTRRVDDNWFEGKIANRKGIFPVSYVEVLTDIGSENLINKPVGVPAAHSLNQPPSVDKLRTILNNEFNSINNSINSNLNHHQTLHIDTDSQPITYRALYKYRPQNNDELELQESDIVYVLEKCDDGWYVGTSQRTGCFGTFPGNYVERVQNC